MLEKSLNLFRYKMLYLIKRQDKIARDRANATNKIINNVHVFVDDMIK